MLNCNSPVKGRGHCAFRQAVDHHFRKEVMGMESTITIQFGNCKITIRIRKRDNRHSDQ